LSIKLLKPSVIIFDDVLKADSKVKLQLVKDIINELRKDRIIIFSTEHMTLASDLCDEFLIIDKGVIKSMDADKMVEFLETKEEDNNA
jgi:ABC-2 type transport system ATP-binding protein